MSLPCPSCPHFAFPELGLWASRASEPPQQLRRALAPASPGRPHPSSWQPGRGNSAVFLPRWQGEQGHQICFSRMICSQRQLRRRCSIYPDEWWFFSKSLWWQIHAGSTNIFPIAISAQAVWFMIHIFKKTRKPAASLYLYGTFRKAILKLSITSNS